MSRRIDQLFARYPVYARCAALCLLALCTALTALLLPGNGYTIAISDGDWHQVVHATQLDPGAALEASGRPLLDHDQLSVTPTADGAEVLVTRAQMVTIHLGDETIMTECSGTTVAEVLDELNITLADQDYVRPSPDTAMQTGMELYVVRVETRELVTEEVVPRQTLSVLDLSLGAGEVRVDDEGADGLARTTTYITYENGAVADHNQVTELVTKPRARRVSTGITHAALEGTATLQVYEPPKPASKPSSSGTSKPSGSSDSGSSSTVSSNVSASYSNASSVSSASGGVLTTSSGETYSYTKVLSCSATAYTTEGFTEKHNASGNIARVGTVAVDPKVIPLGTALYIVTDDGEYIYGYCIAEDTGGAVKGNIVDLFFNTLNECYAFGRRNCTVYVLG